MDPAPFFEHVFFRLCWVQMTTSTPSIARTTDTAEFVGLNIDYSGLKNPPQTSETIYLVPKEPVRGCFMPLTDPTEFTAILYPKEMRLAVACADENKFRFNLNINLNRLEVVRKDPRMEVIAAPNKCFQ